MMVPVVFLVLPVTVLFAVFPGFSFLQFSPVTPEVDHRTERKPP